MRGRERSLPRGQGHLSLVFAWSCRAQVNRGRTPHPPATPRPRQCVPQHRAPSHLLYASLGLNDQLGHIPKDTFSM